MSSGDLFPQRYTTWRDEELRTSFANLHNKILNLTSRIAKIRQMDSAGPKDRTRCTMVCEKLEGEQRIQCLQQCSNVPLGTASVEGYTEYKRRYPIDVAILDRNSSLRRIFERAQVSTVFTDADAADMALILAMPISTEAIPDESWHHALNVLKREEHEKELHRLAKTWVHRRQDFIDVGAADMLMDKIRRHDSEGILVRAVNKANSQ